MRGSDQTDILVGLAGYARELRQIPKDTWRQALVEHLVGKVGAVGYVFVVSLDIMEATDLSRLFVASCKAHGISGRVKDRGLRVVIEPTTFRFQTIGEDLWGDTWRGLSGPRFVEPEALAVLTERTARQWNGTPRP